MKKCLLIFLLLITCFVPIFAEEDVYRLLDAGKQNETLGEYHTYDQARRAWNSIEDAINPIIQYGDQILTMRYGVVEFKVNDSCTLALQFESTNGSMKDVNGCYGIDAAYLSTSRNGRYVSFVLSGDVGTLSVDDVILHPWENLNVRVSSYVVKEGILYHEIKNQLESDYTSAMVPLGEAPAYLKEDIHYYSYDNHFFYENFHIMIDDYRDEIYESAVNAEAPYYNYYQYLPHRSLTTYSYADIEDYFTNELKIDQSIRSYLDLDGNSINDSLNESMYYGYLQDFFGYQYLYGANALMMLSLSINESGYGKSYLAYTRNNLFGHAAYDNDVERSASRYLSPGNSVYSHAKYYISHSYSSIYSPYYHGSFFGNKCAGMNVDYASDPYWGEKAAGYYYRLDAALGGKDKDAYALGISRGNHRVRIYNDAEKNNLKYTLEYSGEMSFVLLAEEEDCYKIQCDTTRDENNRYNFKEDVGYIDKNVLDLIINPEKINQLQYVNITFDGNGGTYNGFDQIMVEVPQAQIPTMIYPVKEKAVFDGYESEVSEAENAVTYVATYRQIQNVEFNGLPKQVEMNRMIDISDASVTVTYEGGQSVELPFTTAMIASFNNSEPGTQVLTVCYADIKKDFDVYVSEAMRKKRSALQAQMDTYIEDDSLGKKVSIDKLLELRTALQETNFLMSQDEIRRLDQLFLKDAEDNVSFCIDDYQELDMGISGMGLSLGLSPEDYDQDIFRTTYSVISSSVPPATVERIADIGEKYGYQESLAFRIRFEKNHKSISTQLPFVVQVAVPNNEEKEVYTVFTIDENQNVYRLPTTRTSSYIQFIAPQDGDFVIMKKNSEDGYEQIPDMRENRDALNADPDNQRIYLTYGAYALVIVVDIILYTLCVKLKRKKKDLWKDYKKSLRKVVIAPEEKPKN